MRQDDSRAPDRPAARSIPGPDSPFVQQLRQGDPNRHDVDVGAMTTQMQVEIVRRHLDEARQRGAKVLAGGEIEVSPEGDKKRHLAYGEGVLVCPTGTGSLKSYVMMCS